MNDSLSIIEAYFKGSLFVEERHSFEERCVNDADFAAEVAGYIAMRDVVRQHLEAQKRAEFALLYEELAPLKQPLKAGIRIKKLSIYLAAACIMLVFGWFLLWKTTDTTQLSEEYIAANFSTLGLNMGGKETTDQLQKGIAAFNAKKYEEAAQLFSAMAGTGKIEPEAVKNLGITYLVMGKYEAAMVQFDRLSGYTLYSNPGLFYKALVLMKRSAGNDKVTAKKLLQEVVDRKLAGSKEAEIWLQKL